MSVRRPGMLTAICVIGLILAALGSLVGLCGIASLTIQLTGNNIGPPPPPDMQAFQQRWLPIQTTIQILKLVVVGLLFLGCFAALNLWPSGRKWLLIAMWSGIVLEVLQVYPTVAMQLQVFELMKDELQHQQQMPPGGPSPEQFFEMIKGLSVAIGLGMVLLKLAYYAWGVSYASLDSTRQFFEAAATDEDDDDDPPANRSAVASDDDPYR